MLPIFSVIYHLISKNTISFLSLHFLSQIILGLKGDCLCFKVVVEKLLKNSLSNASTQDKSGMNYMKVFCIIWMESPKKMYFKQILNKHKFPCVNTDVTFGLLKMTYRGRKRGTVLWIPSRRWIFQRWPCVLQFPQFSQNWDPFRFQ